MVPPLPHLFAFFANPLMLGWLAAAAAPLIIHLWNRRKYREMSWAAIEFLLAALRKNSRRMQLEQWILLAVRTLVVALLVLAVAEPFLEQAGLKFAAGQRTHRVLVLDGSFSMAYKPSDKSRFDRAKELAVQIVDEGQQGDGFTMVLLSDPTRVVVGTPALERTDFIEEVENLRLPHGGADLPGTLEKVEEILNRAAQEHPRLAQSEVYFLTDLGRAGWVPQFSGPAAAAAFHERSKRLSELARLVVIDLGQEGSDNLAVTDIASQESFATVARDVTVTAQMRNFGRQTRSQQLVEFFVDGRRAGEDYVNLEAGGQASVAFAYRFDAPGDHAVEVRLGADLLDIDNHRWLALPVKEQLHVLCVDGKPASAGSSGSADYLAVALAPQSHDPERSVIRPEVVSERELLERDLNSYDCIFLTNVQQFTPSEARILRGYLEQGGGVVIFLGDQVRAESYNEHLFDQLDSPTRVLPARLERTVAESQYHFAPGDYRHPIIRAFSGQERAGLLTTPVLKYFKLSQPEGSKSQVALSFENGDPVIVEETIGRGRSIVVATSADVSWTTMPMWPSYLPIVQELLAAAVGGQLGERNAEVGQSLGASVRTTSTDVKLEVRPPQGTPKPVKLTSTADQSRWTYSETDQSGIYVAQFGAPLSRNETYALNVNTAESDLTKLDLAELRGDEVWPGINFDYETNWQNLDAKPSGEISRRAMFHRWLLYTVLGLLFLESVLAWKFGHRTA